MTPRGVSKKKTARLSSSRPSKTPGKRGPKVDAEQTARRKREIITGAAKLFDRVGYHGVNMSMIAEAAGVKKPTLYHYIRSKREILFELHELMLGTLQNNLDARLAAKVGPLECMRGIVVDVFQLIHDYPGYVRAFFEHFRELGREQRDQIGVKRDALVAQVTDLISEAMSAGVIRKADPRLTAMCLFAIANWPYQWYRPAKDPPPEELAQKCWEILLRGLAVRSAPHRART